MALSIVNTYIEGSIKVDWPTMKATRQLIVQGPRSLINLIITLDK